MKQNMLTYIIHLTLTLYDLRFMHLMHNVCDDIQLDQCILNLQLGDCIFRPHERKKILGHMRKKNQYQENCIKHSHYL